MMHHHIFGMRMIHDSGPTDKMVVTAQVDSRQDLHDEQDYHGVAGGGQSVNGVPRSRCSDGCSYVVLATGTNGLPANALRSASIAPKVFLRAVEI